MFQRTHRHGLAGWGEFFKYPKGDYNDWTNYNQEMLTYCIQDVTLNTLVYERLSREASIQIKARPQFKQALNLEHDFAVVNAEITAKGWKFNMPKAKELKRELTWKLHAIEDELEPQLGSVCMLKGSKEVDKIVKKNGDYYKLITDWYDLDVTTKASDSFITGPFSRIEFSEVRLGQLAEVKKYLSDIGWKPDDWTFKKVAGKWIKMSPKLTDSSLEPLGIVGSMISDYYMLRQRLSMVDNWIEMVAKWGDGRLHGDMFTIGTPSFRCRHRGIVNIPGVHSEYGKDLRALLTCERGHRLVGADSAGNQFRGLAHYMGDDKFTSSVVVGKESDGTDAHSRNAAILGISRTKAKSFIYAYLFGAGVAKLGEVITGLKSPKAGKAADAKFKAAFPKLKDLKDSLVSEYNHNKMKTGIGFIIGADGRRVVVSSEHQLLNYLLQTLEGITCKSALVYQYKKIKELGIEGTYPILFYHDETAWVTPTKHAKTVLDISVAGFREGPKSVGVTCMDGDGKIGINYAEIH